MNVCGAARRGLGLLALLVPASAFVLWSASGAAHACDPVTGEGCDTVPPSTAPPASTSPPSSSPPQTQPPQRQSPPGGGPVTPTTQAAPATVPPTAPPTTLAPPTTAAEEPSTKSDSGGGGVPWQLGLAVPAVVLGAAAAGGAVVIAKKKSDPVAAFTNTCNDLCWLKQQEAQAQAEYDAAKAQLAQVDEAWRQAREYLRNQLRADYIAHKQKRAVATTLLAASTPLSALVTGIGFPLSNAMYGERSQWYGYFSPAHWNRQVNEELISAQALIDGIHREKRGAIEAKQTEAYGKLLDAMNARPQAQAKLDALRAQNPDVAFPPCGCE